MNILRRKLQAAGMTGYCNMDPFTAAGMPQQPMQQQQPQQQPQQTPPLAAPNTITPATQPVQDPTNTHSFPQATDEGLSPLDQVMQSLYNGGQEQQPQQPQQQPQQAPNAAPQQTAQQPQGIDLMKLPMDAINKHAQSMDFSSGIPETTLAKLALDPQTGQPVDMMGGLIEMMNHMGRSVYTQGVQGNSRLVGTSMQQQFEAMQGKLPSMMNRHSVARAIEGKGYHQALQPIVTNAAKQMMQNNPNISADEATATVEQLLQGLQGHLTEQYQHDPQMSEQEQAVLGSSIFDL